MTGVLQKSGHVMRTMNELTRVPELAATMRGLSEEMVRAGIMEELVEETLESVGDEEGLDEEADEQVERVLTELTAGTLLSSYGSKMLRRSSQRCAKRAAELVGQRRRYHRFQSTSHSPISYCGPAIRKWMK